MIRNEAQTNPRRMRGAQRATEGLSAAVVIGALCETLNLDLGEATVALLTWLATQVLHVSLPDAADWARRSNA